MFFSKNKYPAVAYDNISHSYFKYNEKIIIFNNEFELIGFLSTLPMPHYYYTRRKFKKNVKVIRVNNSTMNISKYDDGIEYIDYEIQKWKDDKKKYCEMYKEQ